MAVHAPRAGNEQRADGQLAALAERSEGQCVHVGPTRGSESGREEVTPICLLCGNFRRASQQLSASTWRTALRKCLPERTEKAVARRERLARGGISS